MLEFQNLIFKDLHALHIKDIEIIEYNSIIIFPVFIGPSFVKEMRNVSIAVGRDATIDCHVSNAEDYKVIRIQQIM